MRRISTATIHIFLITLLFLAGCATPEPLALRGNDAKIEKTPYVLWSKDYGPERSGHFRAIDSADFNNDGKLDIIGGSYEPGAIFLWLGDGLGNWKRVQRLPIRADIRSLATGDINKDGWIDLISSSRGDTKGVQLWINDRGRFIRGKPVIEKELFEGLKLVDVNNDGKVDVVAANSTDVNLGGIQVWLGDGMGNFLKETGPTRRGIFMDVNVADVDNDGNPDIIGGGWGDYDGALRVWLGSGDGRWSKQPDVTKGSFWGIETADMDRDGNKDIITASNFDGVRIYYGDGHGNFTRNEVLASTGSFWNVKTRDINGDGILDVVATSNDDNGIVIWYQSGYYKKGKKFFEWTAKDEGLPTKGFYFGLLQRDFNSDGKVDFAAATYGEGIKLWFRGVREPTKPIVKKEAVRKKKIVEKEKLVVPVFFTSIFFDTGSADLRPEAIVILNKLSEYLMRVRESDVQLEGYADPRNINTKRFSSNYELSYARVLAAANYLAANGISKQRIKVSAFGSSRIKYRGYNKEALQKNRRVDITIRYTPKNKGNNIDISSETGQNHKDRGGREISEPKNFFSGSNFYNSEKQNGDKKDVRKISESKTLSGSIDNQDTVKKDDDSATAGELSSRYPFLQTSKTIPTKEYVSFKVVNNIPEYRVGPTDTLEITFWEGVEEMKYKAMVSPTGTISFSYVKDLPVSGLIVSEIEEKLSKLLKSIVKNPRVKVEIPRNNKSAWQVSIFGAVRALPRQPTGPGTYTLYGRERLTQFLSRVGGHMDTADLTHVQLTRKRKTYFLNIFDALFKGDFSQDVFIDDGDVIFIPSKREIKNKVYVFGEVMSPGLYTYDASMSLLEAITLAGGPTFYAQTKNVFIISGDIEKPQAVKINLDDIIRKGDFRKNVALNSGDIIYMTRSTIGDIHTFLKTIAPILSLAQLPTDIYTSTSFPNWEGFPLRQPAPVPGTVIKQTPTMPPDSGPYQVK